MRLHGRVTMSDPAPAAEADADVRGEETIVVDGRDVPPRRPRRPAPRRPAATRRTTCSTAAARRSSGSTSTTTSSVHLCVTVDDDPGQELMRDIGRYLYFKPTEVEVHRP